MFMLFAVVGLVGFCAAGFAVGLLLHPSGGAKHLPLYAVTQASRAAQRLRARATASGLILRRFNGTASPRPTRSRTTPEVPEVPDAGLNGEDLMRKAAVLLMCYNRPDYLRRTLTSLGETEGAGRWPVYVSQDGNHAPTAAVAREFNVTLWQRVRTPLLGPKQQGQAYLAQHYKWALDRVLFERGHSHAVVLEDDMLFSPDFLSLFEQTAWLLQECPPQAPLCCPPLLCPTAVPHCWRHPGPQPLVLPLPLPHPFVSPS